MKAFFSVRLRDQDCDIEGNVCPAEPDVGIMSAYMDDWSIVDPPEAKDWELTEEEVDKVNSAFGDWYAEGEYYGEEN